MQMWFWSIRDEYGRGGFKSPEHAANRAVNGMKIDFGKKRQISPVHCAFMLPLWETLPLNFEA